MHLSKIEFKNHPLFKDLSIDFMNHKTNEPYKIVVFVGENSSGKTSLLNEIFNYSDSKYIINKEELYSFAPKRLWGVFIRQDIKYALALNEISDLIDGQGDIYKTETKAENTPMGQVSSLRMPTALIHPTKGKELVASFNNKNIMDAYESKKIRDIKCGEKVISKITGKSYSFDIDSMSSGEQEILLKIKKIEGIKAGTDIVLYDEPETSLHPRWQKNIMNFLTDSLKVDNGGESPQLFIATHSERIMESVINAGDALIIRLVRENNQIKAERIEDMDLCLPYPTFAELDYVVFDIPSMEYIDQLLVPISNLAGSDNVYGTDKYIFNHCLFNPEIHTKEQTVKNRGRTITYHTWPIYIRNDFHHPTEGAVITENDIRKSIELLQQIIKYSSK